MSVKWGFDSGGWEGGVGSPLYKPYRYVPTQRVGFLHRFILTDGYRFCPFLSAIGYDLRANYNCVSMCSSFQFQMNKKENSKWILRDLFVAMMT